MTPEKIHFTKEKETMLMIGAPLSDLRWLDEVPRDRPGLLIAEGCCTTCQKDWDTAEWYMRIEQPAAAVPYYTSAQVLRAKASDTLMTAQADFHTDFAALSEEISSTPSMTGMSRAPYVVRGVSDPLPGSRPMTSPLTPPPTPPLTPAPTARLANTMQEIANPVDMSLVTPPDTPPASPTVETVSLATAPRSRPLPYQPRNVTGWLQNHPQDSLVVALGSTPEGEDALRYEREFQVNLWLLPRQVSEHDPASTTVRLGAYLPFEQMQKKYIHEMNHVWDAKTNGVVDPKSLVYS